MPSGVGFLFFNIYLHKNMMEKTKFHFNHLGVAVPSLKKALLVYQDIFGYKLIGGFHEDPIQKVNVCFLGPGKEGGVVIELVEPVDENTPVNQWIAKGIGAYHMCYDVDDIDQTLEDVVEQGCIIVNRPVPATAFSGRKVAWFYTTTRQLIEIVER